MLQLTGITKSYGGRPALEDVSFAVRTGRLTGFVGGNGAGKTTTMRIVLGVLAKDAGTVSLDAALVALSGRVRLREGTSRTADDIIRELWGSVFATVHDGSGDQGKVTAPTGATTSP